jgi:hypothetical protein
VKVDSRVGTTAVEWVVDWAEQLVDWKAVKRVEKSVDSRVGQRVGPRGGRWVERTAAKMDDQSAERKVELWVE